MQAHLEACRSGDLHAVQGALRAFRAEYMGGGPPPPQFADALRACVDGLTEGRGDPTLALAIFLFDALMFIPPGMRRAEGPAAPFVLAIQSAGPKLQALRQDGDALIGAWAWHLLSWLPVPIAGVADEALAELPNAARSYQRITLAFAADRAAVTPVLEAWLTQSGEEARVAAMVLTQLYGDPMKPGSVSDAAYARLLELAAGDRWDEWEAAPAREFGFFADLAICLQRAGYTRAATTLPALLGVIERCAPQEIEHVLAVFIKVLFHSHPWPANAQADLFDAAQRDALTKLVRIPRVWSPRPRFYELLQEYGLPLGARPLAILLGVEPPVDAVAVTKVEEGVITLDTNKTPAELANELKNG